ncbi:MAG: hypothetical protein DI598_13880 [Pseudopedobacter saltans]|uniref:TonB C-terminal domain-containing protein n=1 Tax=Pseudopedobacter saltans TaxID=151895 RepID=A0A2W5ESV4_9SPHI|nr:MAG: hypothetical protein DI598_13880 [Pseudopedobacter saltans]
MPKRKQHIDFDDIVFERRNKDYGAYSIRKGYRRRFWWSLWISIAFIVILAFSLNGFDRDFLPPPPKPIKTIDVHIDEFRIPKPPIDKERTETKEEIKAKTTKSKTAPTITTQHTKVKDGNLFIKPNENANIGIDDVTGPNLELTAKLKPVEKKEEILIEPEEIDTKESASTKVNQLPHYLGGDSAWYQYLRANINVSSILRNGAMPSVYTAVIAFVVHPDSSISDFKIVTDPGFGTGAEALRIIKKSGKWVPGKRNNKPVKFAQLQAVVFRIKN